MKNFGGSFADLIWRMMSLHPDIKLWRILRRPQLAAQEPRLLFLIWRMMCFPLILDITERCNPIGHAENRWNIYPTDTTWSVFQTTFRFFVNLIIFHLGGVLGFWDSYQLNFILIISWNVIQNERLKRTCDFWMKRNLDDAMSNHAKHSLLFFALRAKRIPSKNERLKK